jgi:hypothetical protein
LGQSAAFGARQVVAFVDLDDTLFQTRRKCRRGTDLAPAALDRQGLPLSFSEPPQRILVDRVLRGAWIVPATARNMESFGRVLGRPGRGAILSFGAVVIDPSGALDRPWLDRTSALAAGSEPLLRSALALAESVGARRRMAARIRIVSDAGIPFYVVAKTDPGRIPELSELAAELSASFGSEASIHLNGNNLALLPKYLDKAPAVEHFVKTHLPAPPPGGRLVLGVGDSLSDLGFLGLCDYLVIPSSSQLARRLGFPGGPGGAGCDEGGGPGDAGGTGTADGGDAVPGDGGGPP